MCGASPPTDRARLDERLRRATNAPCGRRFRPADCCRLRWSFLLLPRNYLYETRVTEKPELVVDRREIVEACFVHPGVLHEVRDQDEVGEYVRRAAARPSSA
jgi:hypothetical protein